MIATAVEWLPSIAGGGAEIDQAVRQLICRRKVGRRQQVRRLKLLLRFEIVLLKARHQPANHLGFDHVGLELQGFVGV